MTRGNKYIIEITLDINEKSKLFDGKVSYHGSSSFTDYFKIYTNKILIEANRSAKIPLDNIFYNHFSSIYNQILKALLFYYVSTKKFVKIKTIDVSRVRSNRKLEEKVFNSDQFNQVLDSSFKLNFQISKSSLTELFNETSKGRATLIAISYLLIANTSMSESDRFEKLWKSFNKLYTSITGSSRDFDCLRDLRDFVLKNPNILTLSSQYVKKLNTKKLRNSIRWRAMLLSNYDTEKQTKAFRDFVLRYSDKRIMEILLETKYGYRETFLKNKKYFTAVNKHINNNIKKETIHDNELVLLLTGKYMYFVRNKSFHGEKADSAFRLSVNKEDIELKFLNTVLELYLVDLINANNKY